MGDESASLKSYINWDNFWPALYFFLGGLFIGIAIAGIIGMILFPTHTTVIVR